MQNDPAGNRVAGRAETDRLAADQELPPVRGDDSRNDLADGRLARAVLADEGVDRSAPDLEVDAVQGARAAEGLRNVPQLGVRTLGAWMSGRRHPGHSAVNWLTFALVTTPPSGNWATGSMPPLLFPVRSALTRACTARRPSLGRRLSDVRVPRAGGDAGQRGGAGAVTHEDDLAGEVRGLHGLGAAFDALVRADDQVEAPVGRQHVLDRREARGRAEEALPLRDDLDGGIGRDRLPEGAVDRDVQRGGLDVIEVADIAGVQVLGLARLHHERAELGADPGRHERHVGRQARHLRRVSEQVRAEDLVHVDDLDALADRLLHQAGQAGAEDGLKDDPVVLARVDDVL